MAQQGKCPRSIAEWQAAPRRCHAGRSEGCRAQRGDSSLAEFALSLPRARQHVPAAAIPSRRPEERTSPAGSWTCSARD